MLCSTAAQQLQHAWHKHGHQPDFACTIASTCSRSPWGCPLRLLLPCMAAHANAMGSQLDALHRAAALPERCRESVSQIAKQLPLG